jgi:hypothetical protein
VTASTRTTTSLIETVDPTSGADAGLLAFTDQRTYWVASGA